MLLNLEIIGNILVELVEAKTLSSTHRYNCLLSDLFSQSFFSTILSQIET